MPNVKPIPDGYHSITPYLIIKGAAGAIDYYKKAFGATELFRMEHEGKVAMLKSRLATRQSCWPTNNPVWAMSAHQHSEAPL